MERAEYGIMFAVEDHLWWYRGLRGVAALCGNRHGMPARPRVLDAGCGTGATLAHFGPSARLMAGVDYAVDALAFCRQRGLKHLVRASVARLPFKVGAFDAVTAFDVLSHGGVTDKPGAVAELCRVLAPSGILILNLPAYAWLASSHDTHVETDRRFTRPEARQLVERAGLEVLAATYWNTLLFPAVAVVRWWRRAHAPAASDLSEVPHPVVNGLLTAILWVERCLMRLGPLPFGSSLLVVARKRPPC